MKNMCYNVTVKVVKHYPHIISWSPSVCPSCTLSVSPFLYLHTIIVRFCNRNVWIYTILSNSKTGYWIFDRIWRNIKSLPAIISLATKISKMKNITYDTFTLHVETFEFLNVFDFRKFSLGFSILLVLELQ